VLALSSFLGFGVKFRVRVRVRFRVSTSAVSTPTYSDATVTAVPLTETLTEAAGLCTRLIAAEPSATPRTVSRATPPPGAAVASSVTADGTDSSAATPLAAPSSGVTWLGFGLEFGLGEG